METREGLDNALDEDGPEVAPAVRRGLRYLAQVIDTLHHDHVHMIEALEKDQKAVRTLMFSMAATIVIALVGAAIKILISGG